MAVDDSPTGKPKSPKSTAKKLKDVITKRAVDLGCLQGLQNEGIATMLDGKCARQRAGEEMSICTIKSKP